MSQETNNPKAVPERLTGTELEKAIGVLFEEEQYLFEGYGNLEERKQAMKEWYNLAFDRLDTLNGFIPKTENGEPKYGGIYELLAPGRQNDESDEKFAERQEAILAFYENFLQAVARSESSDIGAVLYHDESQREWRTDIGITVKAKKAEILRAIQNGETVKFRRKESDGQVQEVEFSLQSFEDIRGRKREFGEGEDKLGAIGGQVQIYLKGILEQYFDTEDEHILSLNQDKANAWISRIREQIKGITRRNAKETLEKSLNIAIEAASSWVQAYFNEIAMYVDEDELRKYGEALQFFMLFEDGDLTKMRDIAAVYKFGDVGAGKGTLERKTNTADQTFVTGTGGVSKPSEDGPYAHLMKVVSGVKPAVDNGGFNPLMDLLALPQIMAFRNNLNRNGLGNAPIIFDGYPRSIAQAEKVLGKLAEVAPHKVRVFYMSIDEDTALTRILSRIFRSLVENEEDTIRPDDLSELDVEEDSAEDQGRDKIERLKTLLEAVKQEMNKNGIKVDDDKWLQIPKFKEVVTKLARKYDIKINPNGRYARYHRKFPKIINDLRKQYPKLKVVNIDVSNLTPDEVMLAVALAIGLEAVTNDQDIRNKIEVMMNNLQKEPIYHIDDIQVGNAIFYLGKLRSVVKINRHTGIITLKDIYTGKEIEVNVYLNTLWRPHEP